MSISGSYQCTMVCEHPAGMVLKRRGVLTLRESDGQLQGTMFPTFFWVEVPFTCGMVNGEEFSFTAHFGTPCQQFDLAVSGRVEGGALTGVAKSPMGDYQLTGRRVE